jgi:ubiquinone/menaquinone biosynthesis C-methylase UbiE
MIKLTNPFTKTALQFSKEGLTDGDSIVFVKRNGAYRVLLTEDNYTESFGYQWNKFVRTQIDDKQNDLSKFRLFAQTNWDKSDLRGENILEVGSGAGRFSEVILNHTNANLYSVDYSNAVEANFKNNSNFGERFQLFQASIYDMPFEHHQFDKVLCIGVLQHTPDFKLSVKSLIDQVKPGGELIVDFYPIKGWWTKLCSKYIFRPITKKWNHEKLLKKIENNVDWMISASHFLHKIKLGFLSRFIPICDIYNTLPYKILTPQQLKEWCILDTFDMFSPEHDHPQRLATVHNWFVEFGMKNVQSEFKVNTADGIGTAAVVKGIK